MGGDDAELIRRWQDGDEPAFEALVRRWQDPIGRFLARLAGPDDAADLTQEVFLRMHEVFLRARGGYRENGEFRGWLYRVALNAARDASRRERRRPAASSHEPPEVPDPALSADDELRRQERERAVRQALADLPIDQRAVLVLRHYENLSFEAMSVLLKAPASTLKSRFAAALAQLRARLKQAGWLPEDFCT
jgi:RNA polymerase sigma-70 factor (ECF subfamily)